MNHLATPLLDRITYPQDLRELSPEQLKQVASELRSEVIRIVSKTGGHLGASLGVVELTIALHYIFNTPNDKLIWDVGHQTYPHKILTGRRALMTLLRQRGGPSGFTRRDESPYDPFGAGHAATSISAGLGFAVARDYIEGNNHVIAVIGDGAMGSGLAFEALNNAGSMASRLIVILNDNDMSIGRRVGALSTYLTRLMTSPTYQSFRQKAKNVAGKLSRSVEKMARRAEEYTRDAIFGGALFEELGFFYVGPVDGHNLDHLLPVLRNLQERSESGPILLHVVTKKGKGYAPAEASVDRYHAVSKFDVMTGIQTKPRSIAPTYTKIFGHTLTELAQQDQSIIGICAGMPVGSGLDAFSDHFPERFFDVGIAEQHAVTFAAGLACEGLKPFVGIYSSFLQRAYDQIVHDVVLQNLPVRFAIDCAGLVGRDGPVNAGSFDISYLANLPNMVVMAPSDGIELKNMIGTAAAYSDGPIAFRYPRGEAAEADLTHLPQILSIGKGRIIREGTTIALLSFGSRLAECLKASEMLAARGLSVSVADARFAKPLDHELITKLIQTHEIVVTIEEGATGGFSSQVMHFAANQGLLDSGVKIRSMTLPDCLIEQDTIGRQYEEAGLTAKHITAKVLEVLGQQMEAIAATA